MATLITRHTDDREDQKSTNNTTNANKPRGIFIADSNRRYIDLPNTHEWTTPTNTYTTEDVMKYIRDENNMSNIKLAKPIILLIGTNHTRKGIRANHLQEELKQSTDALQKPSRTNTRRP